MIAVRAIPGKGYDTAGSDHHPGNVCTREWLASLPEDVLYICRYLPADGIPKDEPDKRGGDFHGCWSISHLELEWITEAGKGFVPIMWSPKPGDVMSFSEGQRKGWFAVQAAMALGLPTPCHIWPDIEGDIPKQAGTKKCLEFLNGCSRTICSTRYSSGVYDGSDYDSVPINGFDLYHKLGFVNSYWGSVPARKDSRVTPVVRGWAIEQYKSRLVGTLNCDLNVFKLDGKGESPYVVRSAKFLNLGWMNPDFQNAPGQVPVNT